MASGRKSCVFVKFFLVLLSFSFANGQYAGDSCVFRATDQPGVCTRLSNCLPAKMGIRKGVSPQTCSFDGSAAIVCCVGSSPPPTTAPVSVTAAPATRAPLTGGSNPSPSNACPSVPAEAVQIRTSGQKAWDKCIELIDSVYPCVSSSLLPDAPLTRRYTCAHTSTPLIVGGTPASPGEFPHMAHLGFQNGDKINWDCGGSLVSEKWVVTAGHCVFHREYRDVKYIHLGGRDTDAVLPRNELFNVVQIKLHPEYKAGSTYNDIALLELDKKAIYGERIRPACLHTGDHIDAEMAIASGWGTTESRGSQSNTLLKVKLELFGYDICAQKNPVSRKNPDGIRNSTQLCAGHSTESKDTCQGDSGGPLQLYYHSKVHCTYLLIGIVSNGKMCGKAGQPGIYTRVSAFVPWIESVVWP